MCTLSWTALPDGYLLYFNRDERRSREAALAPRIARNGSDGPQHVAAIDAEAGGTWMGVNEFGLSLALLNLYGAEARAAETGSAAPVAGEAFTSRGVLVRELLDAPGLARLELLLGETLKHRRFRPFDLLAFAPAVVDLAPAVLDEGTRAAGLGDRPSPQPACLRYTWDGASLVRDGAPRSPISSSAFDTATVVESRRQLYADMVGNDPTEARLEAFQRSHLPAAGAYSVCMHRPEASTRSLGQIRVDARRVALRYGPGPACRAQLGEPVILARRAARV